MNSVNKEIAKGILKVFNTTPKIIRYANDDNTKITDIVMCNNSPCDGVCSYSTIGLFDTDIGLKNHNVPLRTELLGACDMQMEEFANIISTAAFEIMDSNTAYPGFILNDIVSLYIKNSDMKHLLLTYPFLWDNINNMNFEEFTLAWLMLVPVSDNEKAYCESNGLDALESLFEEQQIDIFDLYRKSVL